jgi:hypothetical protein
MAIAARHSVGSGYEASKAKKSSNEMREFL